MKRKKITVVNDFIGYHQYAAAPEDVSFLRAWHRHHFIVKTSLGVTHNEREIEFFELQNHVYRLVTAAFSKAPEGCEQMLPGIWIGSCESLAEFIVDELKVFIKGELGKEDPFIEVSVSEDGECEATVTEENFY